MSTWRLHLDQKQFTEAPFSTKSYPKLSRCKVTLESSTVWNTEEHIGGAACSEASSEGWAD